MTSKERVLTAMRRQQPDRVPINMRGVQVWNQGWVDSRDPSYRPVIEAVREHCDLICTSGVGGDWHYLLTTAANQMLETQLIDQGEWTIVRTFVHTPQGDLFQDIWESRIGHLPLVRKHFLETPEDAARFLSIPYVKPTYNLTRYRELCEAWPDNLVLLGLPQAPEMVFDIMGTETLAYWWVEHRDLLFTLRDALQQRVLDLLDTVLGMGAGPLLGCNGSEDMAPPMHAAATYREFALSAFPEMTARVHAKGCLLHVHCHNRVNALLEDFVAAGWDAVHPLEPPPMGDVVLSEAKRRVGRDLCLEGNIQIGDLYGAPTETEVQHVEEALAAAKSGGGFILCPSASPHTPKLTDLTARNYLAMIETAVRLREY
jgi:uroporphyrinogen-III decarboxylase